jgi:hypothetical protein
MQIKVSDGIVGIIVFLLLYFLVINWASYSIYQDIVRKHKQLKKVLKYNFFAVLRLNLYKHVSPIYFFLNLTLVIMTILLIIITVIHLCGILEFIYIQIVGIIWFILIMSLSIWLSIYFRKNRSE